jgi:undecaprenyl-diphosphatase
MDLVLFLKAALLGIVEGLTEFLPISSTGHLILVGELLNFNDEKGKLFEIVIQTGAILAVCWEFRSRLLPVISGLRDREEARRFAFNLFVAFVPLAVIGLLFGKFIKAHLFHAVPVALAFIAGGLFILWAEKRPRQVRVEQVESMTWRDALKVGLAQTLALIPGTSRAGATIIGGMWFGMSRVAATEFSFFLAIPTLIAASGYELFKHRDMLAGGDWGTIAVGFLMAFLSALGAVRLLVRYISRHDFTVFAWYRIAFGLAVLATSYFGLIDWSAGQ